MSKTNTEELLEFFKKKTLPSHLRRRPTRIDHGEPRRNRVQREAFPVSSMDTLERTRTRQSTTNIDSIIDKIDNINTYQSETAKGAMLGLGTLICIFGLMGTTISLSADLGVLTVYSLALVGIGVVIGLSDVEAMM